MYCPQMYRKSLPDSILVPLIRLGMRDWAQYLWANSSNQRTKNRVSEDITRYMEGQNNFHFVEFAPNWSLYFQVIHHYACHAFPSREAARDHVTCVID